MKKVHQTERITAITNARNSLPGAQLLDHGSPSNGPRRR